MLECWFVSQFWLEVLGFGRWHFLKLVVRGLWVLQLPFLFHLLMVSVDEINLK